MFESLRTDPTFHPSPRLAMEAEPERIAYTALLSPDASRARRAGRGRRRSGLRDLRHGAAPARHAVPRRRVPPLRLERLQLGAVADVGPRVPEAALPRHPGHPLVAHLHRRHAARSGAADDRARHRARGGVRARPATRGRTPCTAARRASTSARSAARGADGTQGPPGVFLMDCESFDILGKWEIDRGPQQLHYDFWWNLPRDYMVSSEWGAAAAVRERHRRRGPARPIATATSSISGSCAARRHLQTIDLGANHQMALEVRPAHDPTREYGFVGVVVDTTNLEGSIWTWWREGGQFHAKKTAVIPPEPADASLLPPLLQGLRRRAAADQRHRPLARRPLPLRRLLGHGRAAPVRRHRSDEARARRQRAHRRHRAAHAAPERPALRRRPADDGDQPRRQARVLHELALQRMGRAVLSATASRGAR